MSSNTHALREFLDEAAKLGFTLDGYDGNGHPRLRHTNGTTTSVSRTPSDYRSRRNELARLERIAGQKLERANAGHYRNTRVTAAVMAMTDREQSAAQHTEYLVRTADRLRERWADIIRQPSRDNATAARKILADFEDLRTQLAARHRHIPPIGETP